MDAYFIAFPFNSKGWRPDILNPTHPRILIWIHSENNRLFSDRGRPAAGRPSRLIRMGPIISIEGIQCLMTGLGCCITYLKSYKMFDVKAFVRLAWWKTI